MANKGFPSLEHLVALMPFHVYWLDKNGRYLECNESQMKAFGFPPNTNVVGKSNKELPVFKDQPEIAGSLDKINFSTFICFRYLYSLSNDYDISA